MKAEMRLIKRVEEFQPLGDSSNLAHETRGIYVLYKQSRKVDHRGRKYMDFTYVGLGRTCIRQRLRAHARHKMGMWTHYSYFEFHDNITDLEIEELEGLFRFAYRLDSKASGLNIQKGYEPLAKLARERLV